MIRIGNADFSLEIDNSQSPARCCLSAPQMEATLDVEMGERKKLLDFIEKFKSRKHWFAYPSWSSPDGKLLMEKSEQCVLSVTVLPESPEPSAWTLTGMIDLEPDAAQEILEQL